MKINTYKRIAVAVSAIFVAGHVQAGVYCNEKLVQFTTHANGEIFFTTDRTCQPSWCKLNWAGVAQKNGTLTLVTAHSLSRTLSFYWPALTSCSQANAVNASPDSITLL